MSKQIGVSRRSALGGLRWEHGGTLRASTPKQTSLGRETAGPEGLRAAPRCLHVANVSGQGGCSHTVPRSLTRAIPTPTCTWRKAGCVWRLHQTSVVYTVSSCCCHRLHLPHFAQTPAQAPSFGTAPDLKKQLTPGLLSCPIYNQKSV